MDFRGCRLHVEPVARVPVVAAAVPVNGLRVRDGTSISGPVPLGSSQRGPNFSDWQECTVVVVVAVLDVASDHIRCSRNTGDD